MSKKVMLVHMKGKSVSMKGKSVNSQGLLGCN